jgi:hypothetical protein
MLDARMYDDLVGYPHLAERVFTSLARRDEGDKLLKLFGKYCTSGESLYEDVEAHFFEACLLLDCSAEAEEKLVEFARDAARGAQNAMTGKALPRAGAVLLLYWMGGTADSLVDLFARDDARALPAAVARAWLACAVARDGRALRQLQAKLVGHPSDDVARLAAFLDDLQRGHVERVGQYCNQRPRYPMPRKFYDARAWLQLELLSRAPGPVRKNVGRNLGRFAKLARTTQERRILRRVRRRVK